MDRAAKADHLQILLRLRNLLRSGPLGPDSFNRKPNVFQSGEPRQQGIILEHNGAVPMDAADVLYGVSMGRGGVTKVVSRRMPQDEQPALDEADAA